MEEKPRFVFEYEQDERTMSELCERYGIARETAIAIVSKHERELRRRLPR